MKKYLYKPKHLIKLNKKLNLVSSRTLWEKIIDFLQSK